LPVPGLVIPGALAHAWLAPATGKRQAGGALSFRRLTFRSGEIQNARFAPDGQTVIYGATWEGGPARLYLTRPESPESRPFDFGSDRVDILAVSPSGEMAIQLNAAPRGTLARVPMSGGNPRQVLEGVDYAGADWAPEGKDLVVAHWSGSVRNLEYPIGHVLVNSDSWSPRFSPDGRQIAFIEGADTRAVS